MELLKPIQTTGLINESIIVASKWEGELGKRKKKGHAEKALRAFQEGKLELGHPQTFVWRMKPEDFAAQGTPLAPEIQHALSGEGRYTFYVVPIPALLFPAPGSQYACLHAQFQLTMLEGQRRASIQSIFPEPMWQPVLSFGGSLDLALDSHLQWAVGVPQLSASKRLPGELTGRVQNANALTSFIKVLTFEHTLGRMEIESQHSDHTALWRLDSKATIRTQKQMRFVLLLKVPQETKQISLRALAQADPDFDWLTAQLRHVRKHLPDALRDMLDGKKTPPLQDARFWEQPWKIELPA